MAWSVSVMLIQELVLVDFFLACAKERENVESLLWLCKKLAYAWHVCVGTCFFRGVHLVFFVFGVHCSCIQVTGAKSVSKSVSLL